MNKDNSVFTLRYKYVHKITQRGDRVNSLNKYLLCVFIVLSNDYIYSTMWIQSYFNQIYKNMMHIYVLY